MCKELELTNEMIERNDEIDNAVFECIQTLSENPDIQWDMEIIGDVTDAIKSCLHQHGIRVRHPAVVTDEKGNQGYAEYDFSEVA